jgi:hypothetical protein
MMADCMKAGDIVGGKYRLNQRIGAGAMGGWQTAADVARMLEPFAFASTAAYVEGNLPAVPSGLGRPVKDSQPVIATLDESDIVPFDASDTATTLPVHNRAPLGEGEGGAQAMPARTQLLPAADLIADPTPAWRIEMQRVLAANRQQSSPELDAAESEDVRQGGTVVLSRWAVTPAAAPAEQHDPTTSSTAALVRQAVPPGCPDRARGHAASWAFARRGRLPPRTVLGVAVAVPAAVALGLGIKLASPTAVDAGATSPISVDTAPATSAQTAPSPPAAPEPVGPPAPPAAVDAPDASKKVAPGGSDPAPVLSRPDTPAPRLTPSPARPRPSTPDKPFFLPNPFSTESGKNSTGKK